ncbi:phytanoyl-CoA dioxygenase family protein [Enhygromyxa salina]|uniref:phytanoyl-CoA dioxygenase family protein n=1 Tax=Enhygromyxa salina TaxID=215803 RepID=UPI0011B2380B|nr:phytanoyl-CoA dioxygenase family protein [Enhygromyxa salina]
MSTDRWPIDESLDWREHYVRHGFCRIRGLIDPQVLAAARLEVATLVGDPRPLDAWNADRPGQRYEVYYHQQAPGLDALVEQPGLLDVLAGCFGELGFHLGPTDPSDPNRRRLALWVNPYDPDARPRLERRGHIDSGDPQRGLAVHVALAPTRPFGGNTTYVPGSHRIMHQWLREHPDPSFRGGTYPEVPREDPPWEFVAEAGDVVLTHHLVFHSANTACADDRSPRLAIRQEVYPVRPPSLTGTSPFERSLRF